jgi:DNA-binding NarL/FixJ family response regulator
VANRLRAVTPRPTLRPDTEERDMDTREAFVATAQPARPRPLRVAIVDDNEDIRMLIGLHLELDERFECAAQAVDGAEAIALLDRIDIDAMVLDMHMPGLPGSQVLQAVRAAHPEVRIVAFSADSQTLQLAARAGAAATVLKGQNLDGLTAALLRESELIN